MSDPIDPTKVTLADASAAQLAKQLRSAVAADIARRRDAAVAEEAAARTGHAAAKEDVEGRARDVLALLANVLLRSDPDIGFDVNGVMMAGLRKEDDEIEVSVDFNPVNFFNSDLPVDGVPRVSPDAVRRVEFNVTGRLTVGPELAKSVEDYNRANTRNVEASQAYKRIMDEEADVARSYAIIPGLERAWPDRQWPKPVSKGTRALRGVDGQTDADNDQPCLTPDHRIFYKGRWYRMEDVDERVEPNEWQACCSDHPLMNVDVSDKRVQDALQDAKNMDDLRIRLDGLTEQETDALLKGKPLPGAAS